MSRFTDFLDDPYAQRRYLVELYPYNAGGPSPGVVSLYFSSDGFITEPGDNPANQYFDPRVSQALKFTRSLFEQGRIGGKSVPGFGFLELRNEDGGLDALANYAFDGRRVVVRMGGEDFAYSEFGVIYDGTAAGPPEFTDRSVSIPLRDLNYKLAVPLNQTVYAGTGGWEGGAELKGHVKPKAYGPCKDAEPITVDLPTLKYQINDGRVMSILAVKDAGIPLTFSADYATEALLDAATVPAANYATCQLEGKIRLGSKPVGRVTVDLQGDAEGGVYVSSAADIMKRLILTQGSIEPFELVLDSFTNLHLVNQAAVQLYVREPRMLDDALDAVANSIGAWYGFRRDGKLDVGRLELPLQAPVAVFTKIEILRGGFRKVGTKIPPYRLVMGYRPCWTPLSGTELAAAVTDAQRSFMEKPFRTVIAEDLAVRTKHLLSQPVEYVSLLDLETAAQAEANRVHLMEKVGPAIYEVTAKCQPFKIDLGQEIEIRIPRYGLTNGKSFRVISMAEDAQINQVTMEVWG